MKGGGPLENLGTLGAIAFDKTGTLTEGKPRLTDVVGFNGVAEDELLRVAIAVEKLSDHPLAAAVVLGGKERLKGDSALEAHDVQSITGRGVKATVDGQPVYIGKDSLFAEVEGPPLPLPAAAPGAAELGGALYAIGGRATDPAVPCAVLAVASVLYVHKKVVVGGEGSAEGDVLRVGAEG